MSTNNDNLRNSEDNIRFGSKASRKVSSVAGARPNWPVNTLNNRRYPSHVWYTDERMTNALEEAIEKLRELPEERQNALAEALMAVAESDLQPYRLTDEQVAEVRRRRANPDRKFVSLAEARKRLRHFGV